MKDGKVHCEHPGVGLDDFMMLAYDQLNGAYPKFYKMDRLSKLGFLGSEFLLGSTEKCPAYSTAVVLSNSSASLDTDLRYWESVKTQASPSLFVYTLPNIMIGEICIRQGIKGESMFFVSPQFDPQETASYVDLLFERGVADHCLAGWVEVLDGRADVFLYLTGKSNHGIADHTAAKMLELYTWNP
ncbi:MAG TPA: hypothetical protein VKQ08_04390, partial [Cyclobacteriaceae bacterium]|nr:hypothetical protein [Cyclobacteriaceae bacterium]